MDKKFMEKFLVQSTVPGKGKEDRVYDCIWRAHRDVLTGRFHLPCYCEKINDTPISRKVIDSLYSLIQKDNACIYSKKLIEDLCDLYPNIEFGAIQKLVNMSLKYLLVLKEYGDLDIDIDEKNCDCPLDSHILSKIGYSGIHWTSINPEEYKKMQEIIRNFPQSKNGNIYYDFICWQ